jgi:hypothetical protein
MNRNTALAIAALAALPSPALAGGSGPGIGSWPGIIIIVAAGFVGYIICKVTRRK